MSRGIWGDPEGLADRLGTIWAWAITVLVAVAGIGLGIAAVLTYINVLGGPDRWLGAAVCTAGALFCGLGAVTLWALLKSQ